MTQVLLGPDYTQPVANVGRSRGWGAGRTAALGAASALAHVLGSLVLGAAGAAVGLGLARLIPSGLREGACGGSLVVLGIAYASWGIRQAEPAGPDGHTHAGGGHLHALDHVHDPSTGASIQLTPPLLVALYVLSPCAALSAVLLAAAALGGLGAAVCCTGAYAAATLAVMVLACLALALGRPTLPLAGLGRYAQPFAGACVALLGAALLIL